MSRYWYETQERAMAPGIADGWPEIIKAPHTKNGRLVRRDGDPLELLAALKAYVSACHDQGINLGPITGNAEAAIAKAEGRS